MNCALKIWQFYKKNLFFSYEYFTREFLSGKLIDFKMTGNIPKKTLHMMYLSFFEILK